MVSPTTHPMRRVVRRCLALCATAGLAAGVFAVAPATAAVAAEESAPAEELASRFTFAVLPDTQFYSRYSSDQFVPRYGTDPFSVQTDWLAEHAEALRIPFTAHLGDVVDRAGTQHEWEAADRAMKTLDDAGLPYSILPGNHDVLDSRKWDTELDAAAEPFNRWFGKARAAMQSTYGGSDPTGLSQYHIFEAEGQQFMSLALSWRPSDATLAWAQSVLDAHPTVPVILSNHALISVGADQTTPVETGDSTRMWDELIKGNDQIFMTLNGHFHGATRQVKINDFGHPVHQILMDYQMAYEGGNGYLGLFEFDLTNDTISLETGSPWVTFKPQDTLTSYDQPLLDGQHQRFTLDFDFSERFQGFHPGFTAGTPDEPSLSAAARSILLDGFEGPDPIATEPPGNELDFVPAEGTLAHWRFNGHDGVIDGDTVIEDIVGDNDLTRVDPAETNAIGATWEDVTIESDSVHGFSADGAAACFDNSSSTRFSYLTTAADAAINDADLTHGYTIETFVKMDADWDAATNGWSKAITRTGNRSLMGAPRTQWDWTASPTALGISNLREFQFTSLPADATQGDRVNWSGEIMVDAWSHVAVVNDAAAGTTTMYVDGAPVLRNATNVVGQAGMADMPWIIGADWVDDAARNGWHGCVGETRIVDRPTTPDEWLTQRADLSGLTVAQAPEGAVGVGEPVTFAGTGFPGAEVRSTAADARTMVTADGTWELQIAEGLVRGENSIELVQALGTRAGTPVTVEFEVEPMAVAVTASTRILAGKQYVSVVATNHEPSPVDIVIETPYGSKTFLAVGPGRSANVSMNSRMSSVPAGTASVEVTGTIAGETVTMTKLAAYPAS
ncbi:metallophosphoesterase [Microbacterium sp. HD4P20]|uniref:LamG-like jellyroll fold domain-containing protein n=1 Tax=Microbacterium sp. HD4P20 TaxID=2864874 RepID=UPI001C644A09|nr:LamG-like jellyroll fold domain-containing protein [Microbacterium sp. HD4P20]MCP2637347.1 metallophosphoesterase [Microbacterium sp. HD4P20]